MSKAHLKQYPLLLEMHTNAFPYFDNVLLFANHVGMFSEEVSSSGEQMGNMPQAFSHLACISAAMNLERSYSIMSLDFALGFDDLFNAYFRQCIDQY